MTAITTPAKVAHNFPRSFFETTQKRCNSNDAHSMFEQAAGELRAKLLWRGPLHPLRAATPVKGHCTRYGARHPIRRGALPTDRVQHTQSQEQTRKLRRHGPGCGARNTRGATSNTTSTNNAAWPRPVSRPRPRHSVRAAQKGGTARNSASDQAVMSTWSSTAARPASRRATGTRNGEQDT